MLSELDHLIHLFRKHFLAFKMFKKYYYKPTEYVANKKKLWNVIR